MKTKIDCEQILSLLKSGYLDNALDGATLAQVNQHLEKCPACRRTKENLETISLVLRNMPRSNPPEELWPRIQKEIWPVFSPRFKLSENISIAPFRYLFARKNALALATAALLVVAAVGFYFGSSRTDNGGFAPSLASLIGNDEMREPNMNFGSNIEKYLL